MSNPAKKKKAVTKPVTIELATDYLNHRPGSRKSKVHQIFDKQGREPALDFGLKKGLKEGTLISWFSAWNRQAKKPVAKKVAKKVQAAKKKAA